MADVYLAEDQQLGRKVALKLLHRRFAEDPGFVERFRREAQAAAGLQHPNVVSVYDRGTYDDTYYIAMEYLPGRTLKQLIRQEAPLDPVRAIDITIQILKAARFAHRRGVIHRDLKPHNVIVDDSDHAKVTDFGIARAGASDMTETGSIMGTAQYLSPEQAQGHAVSAGSDLYSVGVILYELVTGRVPFDAEAAVTIAIKHVSEAPIAPRAINPSVPPELEQAILWALNKNPADRPADADQFIEALEQVKDVIVSGTRGQRTTSFAAVAAVRHTGRPRPRPARSPALDTSPARCRRRSTTPTAARRRPRRSERPLVAVARGAAGRAAARRRRRGCVPADPSRRRESSRRWCSTGVNDAQANIQNAGFTPNLVYRTDQHKSGIVIAQSPLGGVKAQQGLDRDADGLAGPGNTTVPSVTGLTQNAGQARAQAVGAERHADSVRDLGHGSEPVRRRAPIRRRGSRSRWVRSGDAVHLARASRTSSVPDVTGETQAAATANLKSAGFSVTTSHQSSTTVDAGNGASARTPPAARAPRPARTSTS